MGEFQNKVLRKVLLSVFQLPALFFVSFCFFFRDTRFDVFHCIISALNVLWFYIFMILSVVSQHPPKCVSSCIARVSLFIALFIICVQRALPRRSFVQ